MMPGRSEKAGRGTTIVFLALLLTVSFILLIPRVSLGSQPVPRTIRGCVRGQR